MSLQDIKRRNRKHAIILAILVLAVAGMAIACLFVGAANMTLSDCWDALMGNSSPMRIRIMWLERMPRMLAALIAGAGLAVAGLITKLCLRNKKEDENG